MTTQLQQVAGFNPQDIISVNSDQLVTNSLKVAKVFGKQHKDVLSKLRMLDCSDYYRERNFSLTVKERQNPSGGKPIKSPVCEMTKDGFMFLVMGFTGKKAAEIKEQYINAFNWMADKLTKDHVKHLNKVEYFNQPVVSFEMIDQAHGRVAGHASKRFYGRKKREFLLNKDYFKVAHSEQQLLERFGLNVSASGIILLTRSGYDKLTRGFTEFGADHTRGLMLSRYFEPVAKDKYKGLPPDLLIQSLNLCARWVAVQESSASNVIKVTGLFEWRRDMERFAEALKCEQVVKMIERESSSKCKQAIELLTKRVQLERDLSLTREEYMSQNLQHQVREMAWAKHWDLLR